MTTQLRLVLALFMFFAFVPLQAQYIVSSLDDLPDSDLTDGVHSPPTLRAAIQIINGKGVDATILIAPTLEFKTITLAQTLPDLIPKVTFDGKGIHLDGANKPSVNFGLVVRGNGSSIRNILIENIRGTGLSWQASDGVIEMMIVRNCADPGMNFNGAKRNVIGGALRGYYSNYIYGCSGNGGSGMAFIVGSSNNEIQYTAVGVNETYNKAPNSRHGIYSEDERLHIHHNLISGNEYGGISIDGRGKAMFTSIHDNLVGTSEFGTDTIPNLEHGISITRSSDDTIRNNVVSGNTGNGIIVADATSRRVSIINNIVGTDRKTTKFLPNLNGMRLNGKDHVVSGNVVSGNWYAGIATSANTTIIEGNIIGLDSSMKKSLGNGGDGIHATFLTDAVIGPADTNGVWNVIAGNGGNGIYLGSVGMKNVRITRNLIGSNWTVDSAFANTGNGISVFYDATDIDIDYNVIASNWMNGIVIAANVVTFLDPNRPPIYQRPHDIRVTRNWIGLGFNTDSVLFHGDNGIWIHNSDSILVESNYIVGCLKNGVKIGNDSTRWITVRKNQIGALPTQDFWARNAEYGIYIYGAQDVMIGDEIDSKNGNYIGRNGFCGVQLVDDAQKVKIFGNQICDNAQGGIALQVLDQYYYLYGYDRYDDDYGCNQMQNTPWMWVGAKKDGKLRVAGYLDGTVNTAYRIDVALDEAIHDSIWYAITGCDVVGWFSVRTDSSGYAVFDTLLDVSDIDARLAKHPIVTTTATGIHGTSQFSLKPLAPPDQLAIDIAVDIDTARTKVYDNGRAELTATITNRGFDLATVVTIHDTLGLHFSADSMGISKGVINFFDSVVVATIPTIAPGEKITMRVVGRSLLTGKYVRRVVAFPVQRDLIVANNQDTITLDVSVVNSVDENGISVPSISYRSDGSIVIKGHGGGTLTPFFYDLLGRPVEAAVQRMMVNASEELVLFPPRGSKAIVLRSERSDVGKWVLP